MQENHHLLRPLLNPPSASPSLVDNVPNNLSSNSGIISRLSLVVFIGIVSIWANHEASKGYAITTVNDSGDTFAGRRFHLFYVSNDEATRIVMKASNIIENFLYPDYDSILMSKKPITRVIIRLADRNLTENVIVGSGTNHEFVINISPSILEGINFGHDMNVALGQGVARMWLWDGQGTTSKAKSLIDGIVEYLVNNLGGSFTVPRAEPPGSAAVGRVAEFLNHCERHRPGFIRRLNRVMKDGWDDEKLDGALSRPVHEVCTTYESLRYDSLSE
ncbi:hypothetical protein ACS0TY_018804 [Phlomoides rotata]